MKSPHVEGGRAFLSGRTHAGSALTGLPLEKVAVFGHLYYKIAPLTKITYLPIIDPKNWECTEALWASPVHIKVETYAWPETNGMLIRSVGPARDLLQLSA